MGSLLASKNDSEGFHQPFLLVSCVAFVQQLRWPRCNQSVQKMLNSFKSVESCRDYLVQTQTNSMDQGLMYDDLDYRKKKIRMPMKRSSMLQKKAGSHVSRAPRTSARGSGGYQHLSQSLQPEGEAWPRACKVCAYACTNWPDDI